MTKFKRFPPEGYIQKTLFYTMMFLVWPIFGMKKLPAIPECDPVDEVFIGDAVHVYEPHATNTPKCAHCNKKANFLYITLGTSKRSYCREHLQTCELNSPAYD